jgi:pyridoxal phosphate enzyme (YggS family)
MVEGILASDVRSRVREVRERIARAAERGGRPASAVTLIAVTKTIDAARVREAARAGITDVGENRVREAAEKVEALADLPALRWHLIGHLQRNKARRAVSAVTVIHSIDTLVLAEDVGRHAIPAGKVMDVFAQVNISGEASKSGFAPDELRRRAEVLAAVPGLRWRGLMTMAPEGADEAAQRALFGATRRLHAELAPAFGPAWDALSMGMSNDYVAAIEEGATHVRIGRAIFGERPVTT